ncbi:hypothetical protein [Tautonia rosea]|uniref:hypothetical protein n=1 Tax=Tautonia rosea TaxID=2728037 RepID=UPI001474667F|nr:hypothetical protein [Tautonia rosea]
MPTSTSSLSGQEFSRSHQARLGTMFGQEVEHEGREGLRPLSFVSVFKVCVLESSEASGIGGGLLGAKGLEIRPPNIPSDHDQTVDPDTGYLREQAIG